MLLYAKYLSFSVALDRQKTLLHAQGFYSQMFHLRAKCVALFDKTLRHELVRLGSHSSF